MLAAWRGCGPIVRARARGSARGSSLIAGAAAEELQRAGLLRAGEEGVRVLGSLSPEEYRALLRRARVFVCAPRARGLRDRPARGARRRLPARHHPRARSLRGAADRPRARPATGRRGPRRRAACRAGGSACPTTPRARGEALRPFSRASGRPARRRAATAAPACLASRSSGHGRVLATSAAVSHARRAVATPQRMFASVPVRWASESITIGTPARAAARRGRRRGRGGRGWR